MGIVEKLEEWTIAPKLALLIRISQMAAMYEPGGTHPALDALFWRGLVDLSRDALREFEELERISGVKDSGFVMLPDAGGAR